MFSMVSIWFVRVMAPLLVEKRWPYESLSAAVRLAIQATRRPVGSTRGIPNTFRIMAYVRLARRPTDSDSLPLPCPTDALAVRGGQNKALLSKDVKAFGGRES